MDIMPSSDTGFRVIDQYRNLTKHLEVEHEAPSCKDIISFDQEVPHTRSYSEQGDFYPVEVKMETLDQPENNTYSFMNIFGSTQRPHNTINTDSVSSTTPDHLNNSFSDSMTVNESRIPPMTSLPQSEFQNSYSPSRDSFSTASSVSPYPGLQHSYNISPCFTSSPSTSSPMLSSTIFTPSSSSPVSSSSSSSSLPSSLPFTSQSDISRTSSASEVSGVKCSSYVTELGGSGCVVITPAAPSNPNPTDFLTGEAFTLSNTTPNFLTTDTPPSLCVPEDNNLDYLDLDKQSVSFYDELKLPSDLVKPEPSLQADNFPLEEAALMMRDVIHQDCDALRVPYDPMLWTPENVSIWLSWVCHKNNVPDVSGLVMPMDGRTLCSLSPEEFTSHFSTAGEGIRIELEVWKAANNCFPENMYSQPMVPNRASHTMQMTMAQIPSHVDTKPAPLAPYQARTNTPCLSPAPSTGSDSNQCGSIKLEGSDNSDDEYSSGDSLSTYPTSTNKVGRGHKQTIHLWQFLRELLLSNEDHSDCIRWLDRKAGIFKIEDSKKVASLWGRRKNRPAMNYDKLSRSVRQYYKKKIIKKTAQTKRLVYQFCPGYL